MSILSNCKLTSNNKNNNYNYKISSVNNAARCVVVVVVSFSAELIHGLTTHSLQPPPQAATLKYVLSYLMFSKHEKAIFCMHLLTRDKFLAPVLLFLKRLHYSLL